MGKRRREDGRAPAGGEAKRRSQTPIPLDPVDLLAGLAPGVELHADGFPEADDGDPECATTTVTEAGRMIRSGEGTVRRLIRTTVLKPANEAGSDQSPVEDDDRAGLVARTRDRPGE
jgi:hypothetical protein